YAMWANTYKLRTNITKIIDNINEKVTVTYIMPAGMQANVHVSMISELAGGEREEEECPLGSSGNCGGNEYITLCTKNTECAYPTHKQEGIKFYLKVKEHCFMILKEKNI
ncbi:MAG: hypothetical protein HYU63_06560, partial [Armatimonadetes bacterium]|nr:hypothetical protein [Armatimonadota bacterium]